MAAPEFWFCFEKLPAQVQELAKKNFALWENDLEHPSLHFKALKSGYWSVRVGLHYRAMGRFVEEDTFLWTWIGHHSEYDQRIK